MFGQQLCSAFYRQHLSGGNGSGVNVDVYVYVGVGVGVGVDVGVDVDHDLVVAVDPVSMLMLIWLQLSEAGTNMCWPVFVPHIAENIRMV